MPIESTLLVTVTGGTGGLAQHWSKGSSEGGAAQVPAPAAPARPTPAHRSQAGGPVCEQARAVGRKAPKGADRMINPSLNTGEGLQGGMVVAGAPVPSLAEGWLQARLRTPLEEVTRIPGCRMKRPVGFPQQSKTQDLCPGTPHTTAAGARPPSQFFTNASRGCCFSQPQGCWHHQRCRDRFSPDPAPQQRDKEMNLPLNQEDEGRTCCCLSFSTRVSTQMRQWIYTKR